MRALISASRLDVPRREPSDNKKKIAGCSANSIAATIFHVTRPLMISPDLHETMRRRIEKIFIRNSLPHFDFAVSTFNFETVDFAPYGFQTHGCRAPPLPRLQGMSRSRRLVTPIGLSEYVIPQFRGNFPGG